jgi:hypothetical protein
MVPAHACPLELPAQPAPPRASTHSASNARENARALRSARARSAPMCEMVAEWHCRVVGPTKCTRVNCSTSPGRVRTSLAG